MLPRLVVVATKANPASLRKRRRTSRGTPPVRLYVITRNPKAIIEASVIPATALWLAEGSRPVTGSSQVQSAFFWGERDGCECYSYVRENPGFHRQIEPICAIGGSTRIKRTATKYKAVICGRQSAKRTKRRTRSM